MRFSGNVDSFVTFKTCIIAIMNRMTCCILQYTVYKHASRDVSSFVAILLKIHLVLCIPEIAIVEIERVQFCATFDNQRINFSPLARPTLRSFYCGNSIYGHERSRYMALL